MGNGDSKHKSLNEAQYFQRTRKKHLEFFSKVNGFLENTSEWIYVLKQELIQNSKYKWSKELLKMLRERENYQDLSSKSAFAWNKYNSEKNKVPKVDSNNVCKWRESIANLQTFSYEIEIDPNKKSLHRYLTSQSDCTLHTIIKMFRSSLMKIYTRKDGRKFVLKENISVNLQKYSKELDESILGFCNIMQKIIPKFFLDIPEKIQDLESIIRDSIISGDILELLILVRQELEREKHNEYLQGLQNIGFFRSKSPILGQLERDSNSNYTNAIKSVLEITQSNSIGQMHDAVAMLMNHISLSLYNPENPDAIVEDDTIISAFLFVLARSSAPNLPHYLSILTTFMDQTTLTVKDVGKGVVKLSFLLNNVTDWSTFITY
ncbi:hypothetical protein SteCoe_15159 [Stentor coeruleus]|uniref:VPS9 domain-containing protein n=1 Tax=Stentor coeruleus TaxID=5963 RepID=A0A1R2C4C1_9CILI|nr:hypothetical protein SteCoe_15159 [Stentor coeruleus]